MNISDEQLDRMISDMRESATMSGIRRDESRNEMEKKVHMQNARDAYALVHILETYRDMPKTADGVRVKPGDTVFRITPTGMIVWDNVAIGTDDGWPTQHCYSTREAAEAVKARGK
jgi:hypothetical protein